LDDSEEEELNNHFDESMKDPEQVEDEPEEKINYSLLSREDLVKMLKEKLDQPDQGKVRGDIEEIRKVFQEKQEEEQKRDYPFNHGMHKILGPQK